MKKLDKADEKAGKNTSKHLPQNDSHTAHDDDMYSKSAI